MLGLNRGRRGQEKKSDYFDQVGKQIVAKKSLTMTNRHLIIKDGKEYDKGFTYKTHRRRLVDYDR